MKKIKKRKKKPGKKKIKHKASRRKAIKKTKKIKRRKRATFRRPRQREAYKKMLASRRYYKRKRERPLALPKITRKRPHRGKWVSTDPVLKKYQTYKKQTVEQEDPIPFRQVELKTGLLRDRPWYPKPEYDYDLVFLYYMVKIDVNSPKGRGKPSFKYISKSSSFSLPEKMTLREIIKEIPDYIRGIKDAMKGGKRRQYVWFEKYYGFSVTTRYQITHPEIEEHPDELPEDMPEYIKQEDKKRRAKEARAEKRRKKLGKKKWKPFYE